MLALTMKRRDPFDEFALLIRGETASALGQAGKRLRLAVEALADFDKRRSNNSSDRESLLRDAADALYSYVVQKELIGITDHEMLSKVYGVTPEMWHLMGTIHPESGA